MALGAAALIALLSLAPASQAAYDPLASGTTKLTLDKSFLAFLKQNGVKLEAKSPAKRKGASIAIPVSGGEMDPLIEKGTIEQEGILVFKRGKSSLPFKKLTVKTKTSPLQAKVGGSQLKVAKAKRISFARSGFGTIFSAVDLGLSAKAVIRLNKKLHLGKAFKEGQLIGSLKSRTQPLTTSILAQNRATLVVNPAFVAKLNGLFVSLNPISPAELSPGSSFSFPVILGGAIAPDASLGTLRTGGAIEFLQQGAGQVFQNEFWLDLATKATSAEMEIRPSPPYPGKLGRVEAFGTDPASVSSDPGARTISVAGSPLALSTSTANTFNQAFAEGKATFAAGEPFGTLSFTAQGQ
ncbi:MAG TPA: hypothetical protein VNO20_09915 [Solirubrobacterales bacterium]|nr:hypothetical protein [Solirubrobacterales bacterium]